MRWLIEPINFAGLGVINRIIEEMFNEDKIIIGPTSRTPSGMNALKIFYLHYCWITW